MCTKLGLGRTDSETKSNVLGGPDAKFGVSPDQIGEAYRLAKANGATRFGIHMMTGSCVMNSEYWLETVSVLFDTMAKLRTELGIEFEFMNIGGGLGIPYRPDSPKNDVKTLVGMMKKTLAEKVKEHNIPMPRLYMENGRYMTGPFGWLVTRCRCIKNTYAKYYGVDSCMANLMRPGMYESYHYITVPARDGVAKAQYESSNVVGTLCENNDWFAKNRELPPSEVGDLFVIHDTGAHAHSMGFQYNGKLRAPEILKREDGSMSLIRYREEIKTALYANCVMPSDIAPSNGVAYLEASDDLPTKGYKGTEQKKTGVLDFVSNPTVAWGACAAIALYAVLKSSN
jgi:diaminopimelate decarboxylase